MKKVFTVAVASLVTLLSFAADNPGDRGRLRISNFSRQDIIVVVDGRAINDRDAHSMVGVKPGYHNVKVYRQDNRGRRNRGGIFRNGRGHTLIYNNSVFITPQSEVSVVIDRGGRVSVDRNRGHDRRDRDYGYGRDRDRRDRNWRK